MTNLLFSKKYLAYRVAIGFVLGIAAGLLFFIFHYNISDTVNSNAIRIFYFPSIYASVVFFMLLRYNKATCASSYFILWRLYYS